MEFYECLNALMEKYDVKAADLHRLCSLKRPYISKMLSGDLLPSSYDTVEKIMDAMELTLDEKVAVTDSYLLNKSAGEGKLMWECFKQVYFLQYPHIGQYNRMNTKLINSEIIGADKLLDLLCSMMKNSKTEPMLFFSPITVEAAERISSAFNCIPESTGIKWLAPFNRQGVSDSQNFSLWANCLSVMCVKSCTVMKTLNDVESLLKSTPFPFYLISENGLVIFDSELRNGQFFCDRQIIEIYTTSFSSLAEKSQLLMMSFDKANDALILLNDQIPTVLADKSNCYTISNQPCTCLDLSKTDIYDYTDTDESDKIANMYGIFLRDVFTNIENFYDVFSVYGMRDFLDEQDYYLLGKHFSKSMSKQFRRQTLTNYSMVTLHESYYHPLGLRIPGFNKQPFIGMNIFANGCIIGIYDFKQNPLVVVANDKKLTSSMISYLHELKKYHLISSKEETAKYIQTELEKRADGKEE